MRRESHSTHDASRLLADAIPHIVWTMTPDGVVTYFNRRWTEYTGLDLEETLRNGAETLVHPDDRAAIIELMQRARDTGRDLETWYRLRRRDGAYRWHRAMVIPLERDGERVVSWVGTATDADDARRLLDEQRYLAQATRVLGASLDTEQTLADVCRLVVPHLSDWCAIDLLDEKGQIHRAGVAHVDPEKVALAEEVWRRQPPKPDDPGGSYAVIRTRAPEVHEDIPDALLVASIPDPELLAIFRKLGLRSSMCVPLVAREHVLGTLSLVSAESGRRYGKRDLAFAQDFALRIATAIENARLYGAAKAARAAAEALAADVSEQSRAAEAALLAMRAERDAAIAQAKGGK